ncbi:MAG TPA: GNAT family N-acetyltransferase [Anaerolineales bacterium]|nr:GNAT family N-acetyltransferase [Anaerolineales bacterium]
MGTLSLSARTGEHAHLRALNAFRDLTAVADLIELCFASAMDNEGRRYVSDMRRASRENGFLRWASRIAENTTLPLTGYVWEQDGRIVGNASLIPFRHRGKRIFLIANVAVHPDYRRRGIARALTRRALEHAGEKKAAAVWLHVRDDNPGAIKLYRELGFQEIARRTTWMAEANVSLQKTFDASKERGIRIVPRHPRYWSLQREWLRRIHPDDLAWYRPFDLDTLKPGFWNWLYLLFMDIDLHQWAAVRGDQLLATLSWVPHGGRSETLYAATGIGSAPNRRANEEKTETDVELSAEALTRLLLHARQYVGDPASLSLEYPTGEMTEAFLAAGFRERRTLLWMRV